MNTSPLSPLTEEYALIAEFQSGNSRALEKLMSCESYRRVLMSEAGKAHRRCSRVLYEDFLSAAQLGFVEAARAFDITHANGARLGTYARNFMKEKILAAVSFSSVVTVGKGAIARTVQQRLTAECRARGWSVETLTTRQTDELAVVFKTTRDLILAVAARLLAPEHGDISAMEIAAENDDPLDAIEQRQRRALFLEAKNSVLNEQENLVISTRYSGDDLVTYKSMGSLVGVKRERVRQIELNALKKISEYVQEKLSAPARNVSERRVTHGARRARTHILSAPDFRAPLDKPLQMALFPWLEIPTNPNPASSKKSFCGSPKSASLRGTTQRASASRSTASAAFRSDCLARQMCLQF